jgi:hypothetical protein
MERDREKTIFGKNARKKDHLKQMITRRKKLVFRMLNGDEEEFQPRPPRKPRLKIVK